jgi:Raf kinase inhibitor-like YbhB/YbcL family protein
MTIKNKMKTEKETSVLKITSSAFSQNGFIPTVYTCESTSNVNPPLSIENLPLQTKSLAVIVEDPDAPSGIFDHWIIWNIAPADLIQTNPTSGIEGTNSFGKMGYAGPCPPSGTHHYHFKVYALNDMLNLQAGSGKQDLLEAMNGKILGKGEIVGLYKKNLIPRAEF